MNVTKLKLFLLKNGVLQNPLSPPPPPPATPMNEGIFFISVHTVVIDTIAIERFIMQVSINEKHIGVAIRGGYSIHDMVQNSELIHLKKNFFSFQMQKN